MIISPNFEESARKRPLLRCARALASKQAPTNIPSRHRQPRDRDIIQ